MKILLAVTGSISAYKSYDLVREWTKSGHQVKVILTKGALEFINPQLFLFLGALELYLHDDDFKKTVAGFIPHIGLGKWADRLIIAPCSANTMAKLAAGMSDDLLSSLFLALPTSRPTIIYPAMNVAMFDNPITQENILKLKKISGVFVHPPVEGLLACGDVGKGKLPKVDSIIDLALSINPFAKPQNLSVLITTGATISPLDPVRYLTNPSSGITGYYLAKAFLEQGFDVTVIAGKNSTEKLDQLCYLPDFTLIRNVTTQDMFHSVKQRIHSTNLYISSAAIGDIEFPFAKNKIKKETLDSGQLSFNLSIDILKYVLENRRDQLKVIGFAAETDPNQDVFIKKWKRKPVDLLIGNYVDNGLKDGKESQGFASEKNSYYFIQKGYIDREKELTKEELSKALVDWYLDILYP